MSSGNWTITGKYGYFSLPISGWTLNWPFIIIFSPVCSRSLGVFVLLYPLFENFGKPASLKIVSCTFKALLIGPGRLLSDEFNGLPVKIKVFLLFILVTLSNGGKLYYAVNNWLCALCDDSRANSPVFLQKFESKVGKKHNLFTWLIDSREVTELFPTLVDSNRYPLIWCSPFSDHRTAVLMWKRCGTKKVVSVSKQWLRFVERVRWAGLISFVNASPRLSARFN